MDPWSELQNRYQHLLSPRFRGWEIGDGWQIVILDLLDELDRAHPEVRITQIKEKMGTLRVYTEDKTDETVNALLEEAEERSATICEVYGQRGELIRSEGWVRVRCSTHA